MTRAFPTPQDAEDAFYDAIDDRDAAAMRAVWDSSDDIACLFPMQPLLQGQAVQEAWMPLMRGEVTIDIQVNHIRWVSLGDVAIHYVEERVSVPGQAPNPPVYATNVYRQRPEGWRLILHQNSPSPPTPGTVPPIATT
jgi:ketosteroid isomerase-like protein